MPRLHWLSAFVLMLCTSLLAQEAERTPVPWAYPINTPGVETQLDPERPYSIPGSDRRYSPAQMNLFNPPDWNPEGHPAMPPIVARGREPGVFACGYCHLPNGQGKPENSSLAGLPAEYIMQQIADYQAGRRGTSVTAMGPPMTMIALAQNVTPAEARQAAEYFSSLEPRQWIRVVETDTVPESMVFGWKYIPVEDGGSEPIGMRIVEMPENVRRTELRDDSSGFVAYVPPGSLERGRELIETGGDNRTLACASCHGPDLRGLGPVPSIAGRSPSYIARQLNDFQGGVRRGLWSPLMDEVVDDLTPEDMVAISAYAASLAP